MPTAWQTTSATLVARDRVEQKLAGVTVLIHVPDGAVTAGEHDRVVAVGRDVRDRLGIVQPRMLLVDLAKLRDSLFAPAASGSSDRSSTTGGDPDGVAIVTSTPSASSVVSGSMHSSAQYPSSLTTNSALVMRDSPLVCST